MSRYFEITKSEFIHFKRSPLKMTSFILFGIAIIYGCQKGYDLLRAHDKQITFIEDESDRSVQDMLIKYDEIASGAIEKPRRDPTVPYWGIWYTPTHAFKHPSSMMVFSIGQAEQYGYYKRVSNWSSTFDNDLAEEISNPERIAVGTLDFNFVLIYLTPILLIILLFNIGGLEKDLKFDNVINLNSTSNKSWLLSRFSFYFAITFILLLFLATFYALISNVFQSDVQSFINLILIIFIYLLFWSIIFYFINIYGSGSADQAIKMISVWMVFCIIIPGTVHQLVSIKYPTNYMTDYLDVSRDKRYDIFELSSDSLKIKLLEEFSSLQNTAYASDTIIDKSIINRSVSGLVNLLNKDVANSIEDLSEQKNLFIKSLSKVNPITFFQNQINNITRTDFYAYRRYRDKIQKIIDTKIMLILSDTWNEVVVSKEKYIEYVTTFK